MILIKEENDNTSSFYERIKNTQNNVFLCKSEKKSNNANNNEIKNNVIQYTLNEKIIQYQTEKINKILTKIEENINNFNNIKYYKKYFKEKKKLKKEFKKNYKKINNITKKIFYGGNKNKLLNKANNRRLIENKSLL